MAYIVNYKDMVENLEFLVKRFKEKNKPINILFYERDNPYMLYEHLVANKYKSKLPVPQPLNKFYITCNNIEKSFRQIYLETTDMKIDLGLDSSILMNKEKVLKIVNKFLGPCLIYV